MDEFYPGYIRIPGTDTLTAQALMYASSVNCYIVYASLSLLDAYAYIKTIPPALELTNPVSPTDVVYFNYNTGEDDEDAPINDAGFYMRWGHLLQFINSNVISVIKGSSTNGKSTPLVYIDCETWSNKMYTLPYQVSLDPRVCIVKSLDDINTKKYYQEIDPFKSAKFDYAWPMNIYLSHNQIISSLNENMDEKGNVALFDFLNSLCIAVNKAMGGINNLEPFLNEDTNTLHIVDASYQAPPPKNPYIMHLYGYNKDQNQAGFVRNFNLKTEITNDFATMATIGSTAGGYVKGTENTMFSKWNKGLIDRWKEEYETPDPESRPKPGEIDEPAKMYVEEFWIKRYDAFGLTLMDLADDWSLVSSYDDNAGLNDDIIDSNIAVVTEFYKYIQAKIQKEKQEQSGSYSSPSNGFIPINLGITMDGISGVKIYNEINVNTSFLPNNYPESLRFIIKGVSHKLSDSDWETTLETVVVSKSNDKQNPLPTQSQIKAIMDKYIQDGASSSGVGNALTTVLDSVGFNTGGAPGGAGGTGSNKSPVLETPSKSQTNSKLEKSTKESAISIYKAKGAVAGQCGAYTYLIAESLAKKLTSKSAFPGTGKGGNHAWSSTLRSHLGQLGIYTNASLTPIAVNVDKATAKKTAEEITKKANYGDALVYYGSPGEPINSTRPYFFHAQIYTGNQYNGTGWSTSTKNNYGTSFVYGSKPQNSYTMYWFRIRDEYKK